MRHDLSEESISELKTWIEQNIKDQYFIDDTDFYKFLNGPWIDKHYPDFKHVVTILTNSHSDAVSYIVYLCKSEKDYELYIKNKFLVTSELKHLWLSYLIDNNIFSFRILCNLFGIEIFRSES
jgi:hypothetical protein